MSSGLPSASDCTRTFAGGKGNSTAHESEELKRALDAVALCDVGRIEVRQHCKPRIPVAAP